MAALQSISKNGGATHMNSNNLDHLISSYIDHFERINNDTNNENYKWCAIVDFQAAFDLSAADDAFADMLKKSRDATSNLIDSSTQPFFGLVELAKREPAAIRRLLKDLLADDGSNLALRQEKINTFVKDCNCLVERYFPGSYLYRNDQRSAMAYQFLNDPENHYLYKATESKFFADCVGFYDDWGSMAEFKLDIFYRFCDEVLAGLKANQALLDTHKSRFAYAKKPMYPDPSLHVLLFDLIYCAHTYDLYAGCHFEKITAAARKLYLERRAKARALAAALREAENAAVLLDEARTYFGRALTSGAAITHKTFGAVDAVRIDGAQVILKIRKTGDLKKFELLNCISNGFIKIDVPDFGERLEKYKDILPREYSLPKACARAREALRPYEEYLD